MTKERKKNQSEEREDLKVIGATPIDHSAEEISELAEGEEQAVAEVGGQGGDVRNRNHVCEWGTARSGKLWGYSAELGGV